jgi:hypothetical protein
MRQRRHVLIAYSQGDRELAELLSASLQARGVSTFLEQKDILTGQSLPQKMFDAIVS